jgi:hypothetical protein
MLHLDATRYEGNMLDIKYQCRLKQHFFTLPSRILVLAVEDPKLRIWLRLTELSTGCRVTVNSLRPSRSLKIYTMYRS